MPKLLDTAQKHSDLNCSLLLLSARVLYSKLAKQAHKKCCRNVNYTQRDRLLPNATPGEDESRACGVYPRETLCFCASGVDAFIELKYVERGNYWRLCRAQTGFPQTLAKMADSLSWCIPWTRVECLRSNCGNIARVALNCKPIRFQSTHFPRSYH